MKDNIIKNKSFDFAVRIVKLNAYLTKNNKANPLFKQLLRSGTSVGANVRESENASSKADFINKLSIALKEANETEYWLELLNKADILSNIEFENIYKDCKELVKLLVAIIKTSKGTKYE